MKKYIEILENVRLFSDIDKNELLSLLDCLNVTVRTYKKGESIFLYGDKVDYLGIVLTGLVQVVKEDYYGNRSILANIQKSNLFGEVFAFSTVEKVPVSVFAIEDSKVLLINYEKIIKPCSNSCSFHGKLIYNMLHIISDKNLLLNEKIEYLSKPTTREKLLSYLSEQAKRNNSNEFHIQFNRQELADYLSVNRSAMSSELSKLKEEGIIEYKKNYFKIISNYN